jgi:hypothetical protein
VSNDFLSFVVATGVVLMKSSLIGFFLAFSVASHAGLVVDVSQANVLGSNDRYGIIGKQVGYRGAVLFSDDAALTPITVEFVGSQAKYHNRFLLSSGQEFLTIDNHPGGASGVVKANDANRQTQTINYLANQLLDFRFTVDWGWDGPDVDKMAKNGGDVVGKLFSPDVYFWTRLERNQAGDIESILLGLEDGGGYPSPDLDHDDLVVRLSGFGSAKIITSEVPLQGASLFMASALLGLLCGRQLKVGYSIKHGSE